MNFKGEMGCRVEMGYWDEICCSDEKMGCLAFLLFTSLTSTSIAFRLSTTSISNSALDKWDHQHDHHQWDHQPHDHLCVVISVLISLVIICVVTVSLSLSLSQTLVFRTSILTIIGDLPATTYHSDVITF